MRFSQLFMYRSTAFLYLHGSESIHYADWNNMETFNGKNLPGSVFVTWCCTWYSKLIAFKSISFLSLVHITGMSAGTSYTETNYEKQSKNYEMK